MIRTVNIGYPCYSYSISVDEVQYDKDWALLGKLIYDDSSNIFMIFTGSSAIEFEYNADASRRLVKCL